MADKNPILSARVHENDQKDFKNAARSFGGTDAEFFAQLMKLYKANAGAAVPDTIPDDILNLNLVLKRITEIVTGMRAGFAVELEAEKNSADKQIKQLKSGFDELVKSNTNLKEVSDFYKRESALSSSLKSEIATFKSTNENLSELNQKLSKEIKNQKDAESELETIKIQLAKFQADVVQLKERLEECQGEKKLLLDKLK